MSVMSSVIANFIICGTTACSAELYTWYSAESTLMCRPLMSLVWHCWCHLCDIAVFQLLECMYVRQALDLLEGLIPESEDNKDISPNHLKLLIVFSIMWSLGALLEHSDRQKVSPHFFVKLCYKFFSISVNITNTSVYRVDQKNWTIFKSV